jgi:hypothetical protein
MIAPAQSLNENVHPSLIGNDAAAALGDFASIGKRATRIRTETNNLLAKDRTNDKDNAITQTITLNRHG